MTQTLLSNNVAAGHTASKDQLLKVRCWHVYIAAFYGVMAQYTLYTRIYRLGLKRFAVFQSPFQGNWTVETFEQA